MASLFNLAAVKNTLDEVRAQVYPRNETERKVYEALSSKNWGASTTLLNELASDTYDYEKYKIITDIVWGNLITDGKNWRQIFKTLTLIEFFIKNGAERFIEDCRDRLHKIRQLQDYNYYENDMDKGSGVREKSKQIVELLNNNEAIRSEREKAKALRNKFVGIDSRNTGGPYGGFGNNGGYSGSGGGYSGSGSDSYSTGGRYDSYDSSSKFSGDHFNNSNNRRSSGTTEISSGRYGGGAYDSNRPPRYDDDAAAAVSQFEEAKVVSKPSTGTKNTSSTTSTGGKLKVSIKKVSSHSEPQNKNIEVDVMPTGDIDLIGGFDNGPVTANADFDPFTSSNAVSTSLSDFDPFGSETPVFTSATSFGVAPAPPATNFDPFGMGAVAPPPPFNAFPPSAPMGFPQPQPSYGAPYPASAPITMVSANPGSYQSTPTNQLASITAGSPNIHYNSTSTMASNSQDVDFGDFEAAPQQKSNVGKAPNTDKWGDLSKLVDLSKIEKNEAVSAKQSSSNSASQSYANNSFAGLDGFSKAPQNMNTTTNRPLGTMGASLNSSQPIMLNRQPMVGASMGGGVNYNMGQNPMGPMGGNMLSGTPVGMNMMGFPMNSSGYGAPAGGMHPGNSAAYNNGMMNMAGNAAIGQPGIYPGQGMGTNGYPPQNYGMPPYRNAF